ncbi:alanine acetyltransferase [Aliidongia dinghuensis]|uniref:Alanine acetyltransferase n=1 Tax=Aliidongia dinghuensis TaxID=1867774 RepID=A0A8J3E195_9PROT|nr:GNAT family N-acetyltransferase [Aliidongia dinghuensis]GGE99730.1 alanine acetyltransferase [Aliidongia dinghuensis]
MSKLKDKTDLAIVPLGAAEIRVAALIHKEAFGFDAWDERAIGDLLAMPGAVGRLAVDRAAEPPEPLGFTLLLFVAEDAELLTVGVRPATRRRGVATRLMQDFFEVARTRKATNAFLEVAADNIPAQRLYSRLGFLVEGTRRDYYKRPGNKRVAAHLLRRPISKNSES